MNQDHTGDIILYQTEDGTTRIEVRFENDNIWLTQQQMAELYQTSRTNVVEHIKHIIEEGELMESSTCRKFRQVQQEGKRQVERELPYYNLDMIISLGYRIKSRTATKFRIWATERLKDYLVKGYSLDDERLKQAGGGGYWYELLNRIRDIRSSEKVMYRQVLDLYATSVDYDPNTPESEEFFKIVQNKLHFAAHGHTAAEIIYNRADSDKPFMGLTVFSGKQPTSKDVIIAKNYLTEDELKILNNLVSGYFDFAEIQALRRKPMFMGDHIAQLDKILSATGEPILTGAGNISHQKAIDKAKLEFKKFQLKTISPVESAYLDNIRALQKKIDKNAK
jgi:hypothetical protein